MRSVGEIRCFEFNYYKIIWIEFKSGLLLRNAASKFTISSVCYFHIEIDFYGKM